MMYRLISFVAMTVALCVPLSEAHAQHNRSSLPIIITDPDDPGYIRGTASIAIIWGKTVRPPQTDHNSVLPNLIDVVREYTDITVTGHSRLSITSPLLHSIPLAILMTEEAFVLSPPEKDAVKEYLDSGGFLFCENTLATVRNSPVESSFRDLMEELYGGDVTFTKIGSDHPVFHSFFDFDNGLPVQHRGSIINMSSFVAVTHNGACVAIYSNKGLLSSWNDQSGNILELKMGVNMLIFVLKRDESMAVKH